MLNYKESFLLLFVIFLIIFIISYFYTKNKKRKEEVTNKKIIKNYMGFIFIIFGILKLYDLNKFTDIFSKYDLISQKIKIYPYLYPFIEIIIGFILIKDIHIKEALITTIFLMIISIISIIISVNSGKVLRCGCLGSLFHLPLSYITLSENIMMLFMSLNYLL